MSTGVDNAGKEGEGAATLFGALSPLTGLLGSSNVGGHFGAELRAAGIQTLLIKGRSPHPVMLHIQGEDVELRDAAHLWGLDTEDTVDRTTGRPSELWEIMQVSSLSQPIPQGPTNLLYHKVPTN